MSPPKLFIPPAPGTPASRVADDTAGLARGWKTTEFWFTAVGMMATLAVMSDLVPPPGHGNPIAGAVSKTIVAVANVYQIIMYIRSRAELKKVNMETTKDIEVARTTADQMRVVEVTADVVKLEDQHAGPK